MGSVRQSPILVTVLLLWISSFVESDSNYDAYLGGWLKSVGSGFLDDDESTPPPPQAVEHNAAKKSKKKSEKKKSDDGGDDDDDEDGDKAPWVFKGPVTAIVKDKIRKPVKKRKSESVNLIYLDGKAVTPTIVVDCKAKADFKTINAAINYLYKNPSLPNERAVIYLRSCVYREKVLFRKAAGKVTLKGEDVYGVTISWGDTAGTVAKNDSGVVAPLKTYGSYTLAAMSDYFVMEDITVINTAPEPDPLEFPPTGMAVAYRCTANFTAAYHNRYISWQDTLYDHRGVHYWYGCYIQGSVDFVFGNGQSIYENCTFYGMNVGAITAQKRMLPKQKSGFVILRSQVLGFSISNLGRPWGNYSRVVYLECYLEGIRKDQNGWMPWAPGFEFRLRQVFYGEHRCYGPGAATTNRNNWTYILTDKQAAPFYKYSFITGGKYNGPWLPGPPDDYDLKPFNAPPRPPPAANLPAISGNPGVQSSTPGPAIAPAAAADAAPAEAQSTPNNTDSPVTVTFPTNANAPAPLPPQTVEPQASVTVPGPSKASEQEADSPSVDNLAAPSPPP